MANKTKLILPTELLEHDRVVDRVNKMTKENELKAKNTWYNNSNYSKQCGSSPFSFFVYALILGAFWNVKKIQKLGLL